jgi:hypothetical protein
MESARKRFPLIAVLSYFPLLLGLIWFSLIISEMIFGPPAGVEGDDNPLVFWLFVQLVFSISASISIVASNKRGECSKGFRRLTLFLSWFPCLITVGISSLGRLLVVAHTERGNAVRIINARPATAHERKKHEG